MKATVIGCGRWGTFIAWYLGKIGQKVTLYGRKESANMQQLISERKNDILFLEDSIKLTTSINEVKNSEVIIISVNSQGLRSLFNELKSLDLKSKIFVLCMKGIEINTGQRLSQIAEEYTDKSNKIAVWLGPGHVQEFHKGIPNCMVIDSDDKNTKELLVKEFSSNLIRFYYGQDMLGNEIGAAAKNVIGIAAGMLDGLHLSTLKGALMSRGTKEIARLIKAMGGNELSAYGLCHLGDYEATVFSEYSHNRKFGQLFIQEKAYTELAEGCHTVKAMMKLKEEYNTELPICEAVYTILYENANAQKVLNGLFSRSIKKEI